MIGVEEANYAVSSSVIVALDASYGNKYSCQLSLIKRSYPAKVLGTAGFIVSNGNASARMKSFPIAKSKDDVVFRVVTAKDYLRGKIEIAEINRKQKFFVDVKKIKSTIFDNVTFFSEEPIGVKVFKNKDYHLQVACSHI